MAGRKKENAKRYSVPVTEDQEALIAKELKYQRVEESSNTRCTAEGKLLGRLIAEAITARFAARGTPPVDAADGPACDARGKTDNPPGSPSIDPKNPDEEDGSPGGDGGGPGMPAAIPG